MLFFGVMITAYFLGSVPTGFLVARTRGVDIRAAGSGNIGATNVFRILGKPAGIFVLLADAAKGILACTVVVHSVAQLLGSTLSTENTESLALAAGVATILGHNYTCWLGFKGGKGIATSAGVLGAVVPLGFAIAFGVWLTVFAISRYVSLASISAAIALPIGVWLTGSSGQLIWVSAGLSALAIFKHRSNIRRLLSGTENRIGPKRNPASS
ncbi:MAG: glycerol-3-phosphate 1-O-acyltransferase PlsY [Verrucomicrobia bacterium]|nr:glycerol-3-phosphate 1-O-acyltransferase PlsY [Verrucomicrobiota bacterium]